MFLQKSCNIFFWYLFKIFSNIKILSNFFTANVEKDKSAYRVFEYQNPRPLHSGWRDLSCRQIFPPVTCSARIVTRADTWQFHASGAPEIPASVALQFLFTLFTPREK